MDMLGSGMLRTKIPQNLPEFPHGYRSTQPLNLSVAEEKLQKVIKVGH